MMDNRKFRSRPRSWDTLYQNRRPFASNQVMYACPALSYMKKINYRYATGATSCRSLPVPVLAGTVPVGVSCTCTCTVQCIWMYM